MDDIRIKVGLTRHPKWRALGRALGAEAQVALIELWLYARECHPKTGTLTGLSDAEVEEACGWKGQSGSLCRSLCELHLLDRDGLWWRVHDWEQHQPWATRADHRSSVARKNAAKRWDARRGSKGERDTNGDATSNANGIADGNAPLPSSPLLSSPKEGGREGEAATQPTSPTGSVASQPRRGVEAASPGPVTLCVDCKRSPPAAGRAVCSGCAEPEVGPRVDAAAMLKAALAGRGASQNGRQ